MHPHTQALAEWLGTAEFARVRDWPWDFTGVAKLESDTLIGPGRGIPELGSQDAVVEVAVDDQNQDNWDSLGRKQYWEKRA